MTIGYLIYKDIIAQQHPNALVAFKEFLKEVRPKRILEIGTSYGGLTLFLRDTLDEIGLESSEIKSIDIYDRNLGFLKDRGIDVFLGNIFDNTYTKILKPEIIKEFIKNPGITVVLCDGGHKIGEFNSIAPLLKRGDFIMAHDYIKDVDTYEKEYKNKVWNWCEVTYKAVEQACIENNLEPYNQDVFDQAVWICRRKR